MSSNSNEIQNVEQSVNEESIRGSIKERLLEAEDAWDIVSKRYSVKAIDEYDESIASFAMDLYRMSESQRKIDRSDHVDRKHVQDANRFLRSNKTPSALDSIILPGLGFMFIGNGLSVCFNWFKSPDGITSNEILITISTLLAGFILVAIVAARVFKK